MTQYAIVTDLNRCVGCYSCNAACKTQNGVAVGSFWNHIERVGPHPAYEGAEWPDIEWYYLPVQCQHCANPQCVEVCPTGASFKHEDGTVLVDRDACIGCELCLSACPYGVRLINSETSTAEKCTLCHDLAEEGGLPQCVSQCVGMAKWFGDLEAGIETFEGPEDTTGERRVLGSYLKAYEADELHAFRDEGNEPSFLYILRNKTWYDAV